MEVPYTSDMGVVETAKGCVTGRRPRFTTDFCRRRPERVVGRRTVVKLGRWNGVGRRMGIINYVRARYYA